MRASKVELPPVVVAAALIGVLLLAACGDGGDDPAAKGGPTATANGATDGAKVIDADAMEGAKGSVTVCQEKDLSGNITEAIKRFNARQGDVHANLIQFAAKADDQRTQFIQRQEARSSECDVFHSDVIWTAEFASQKWIYDMTPYVRARTSELIPATVRAASYDGKIWGMPQDTGAGFLYYRTDQLERPPRTWQEAYRTAGSRDGIVYQGASYEGLTGTSSSWRTRPADR